MNKLYFAITLIGILSFVSFAQKSKVQMTDKPDFTGTWENENKKSFSFENRMLIITHVNEELNISESFEYKKKPISNNLILYSDGRGERNFIFVPGVDSKVEIKSKTSWKKNKLIRKFSFTLSVPGNTERNLYDHETTEKYSLSKDGNSLIVESLTYIKTPPSNEMITHPEKTIYRRKN